MTEESRLIVAVDPAVEGDGGIDVGEVTELGVKLVWGASLPIEPGRAMVVTAEFARSLGDNVAKPGDATRQTNNATSAWVAGLFDVPLHIMGIPYVVDRNIPGIRVEGGPFVPLKTGPRLERTRAEWARILRVHRALRRRARRHGQPAPTEQQRVPVAAVTVSNPLYGGQMARDDPEGPTFTRRSMIAELYGTDGGPFDADAMSAMAERLNRTEFN